MARLGGRRGARGSECSGRDEWRAVGKRGGPAVLQGGHGLLNVGIGEDMGLRLRVHAVSFEPRFHSGYAEKLE